ncbi:endo-1,4-beta-xylanase [Thermostilla marina]
MSDRMNALRRHGERLIASRRSFLKASAALFAAGNVCALPRIGRAQRPDADWLAEAEERIEKHRKQEIVGTAFDPQTGRPLADVEVTLTQKSHAFLFGCNIFRWGKLESAELENAYRARFRELLNYATTGFYWPSYERRRGEPNHAYAEALARWCKENGIALKGHPLAWNYADPWWLPDDPETIRRLQMERITDCVSRFAGLIDRWDVVNEVARFEGKRNRAPKMTDMWAKTGKMEFTRQCFVTARKANPNATLLINDYEVGPLYEEVVEQLVDENGNRLYDVIGIQSHQHRGTWDNAKIWDVCERFSRFGVPLHFTETTILSLPPNQWKGQGSAWEYSDEGDRYQEKEVIRFYTMLFSHPAVTAITWWDFSDNGAWQRAPAGLVRKDMTPKPAYKALMRLIKEKWWSVETVRTDAQGRYRARVFAGTYDVRIAGVDAPQEIRVV